MNEIQFNITDVKALAFNKIAGFTDDRIADMEACFNFIDKPEPPIMTMKALRDDFQTKQANYKTTPSELNRQIRNTAFDALVNGHLTWITTSKPFIGNDQDRARRFGYPQYSTRTDAEIPEGVPAKPKMELTPNPGQVILVAAVYKQGKKQIWYNWQISDDGGETATYLPNIGGSHRRKTTLEIGVALLVRVAYATTAGEGEMSEWLEISLARDDVGKPKKKAKKKVA